MNEIKISTDIIKLDSFLKWCGAVSQGSEAKIFIKNGMVKVNGEVEVRRGRKLSKGFTVEFQEKTYKII
ncbi:RNA-binding S4 domain-containing protein [Clostridium sp. AWRP]|uniref:RNA-binding S4 domain-containing protein n=1 Tax=Clostridium sp. AWRP TaxID=2212991 RepID=UPI000FD8BFD7|nr:RNA-binding S4 domain-containing protein [Clostridium sp. AWRP]AZV55132.1 RNA-binding S4 domain-containing protein [Clostridium sp. AWRP]